jgi:putative ABC transport system substrate-binding protein
VSYQFKGLTKSEELEAEAKNLMDAKVDVIIAIGTAPARATKAATAGTEIPVVFAPGADPVKLGFVKSMANPEGNLTGIATGYQYPTRALEYLLKILPKAKRVLLFHNPSETSIPFLPLLPPSQEAATKLGLELIVQTVKNGDELTTALGNMPADVDAMLYLPDTLVGARFDDVLKAAFSHKIPVVAGDKYKVENGALLSYGWDYVALGKQTAALADKVLKGTKPAALAIETTEFFLSANLKTAGSIGLNIPDDVLRQATTIVR